MGELAPQAALTMRNATRSLIRSGYRFSTVETTPVDQSGNRRYMLRSHWGIVENGFLERIWGTNRDITELKRYQMEHELPWQAFENASEERLELLGAKMPEGDLHMYSARE